MQRQLLKTTHFVVKITTSIVGDCLVPAVRYKSQTKEEVKLSATLRWSCNKTVSKLCKNCFETVLFQFHFSVRTVQDGLLAVSGRAPTQQRERVASIACS